jgi:phosphoribosylaminoimidazolecarboxamide formyltransferase / IMP cyclohydrolase
MIAVKRALISVSDKTGLIEFATELSKLGIEIVSTGSTAKQIAQSGIAVTEVSAVTGFPESLDGRVKTLHPAIHAGILADLRLESHQRQLAEMGVKPFQLVVVNLYPFSETVAAGAGFEETIEQIDVGGPAMVRASAKNHANVAVVVDPARYSLVLEAIRQGGTSEVLRKQLALEAFQHTAKYDSAIAGWLAGSSDELSLSYQKKSDLRYGENAHQAASVFVDGTISGLANATQLGGKEMSFNNYVDTEAALRAAYDFVEPAVAIIKHANPCGLAVGSTGSDLILDAYTKAHSTDPVSAYGGVIAANRAVTAAMAQAVSEVFTEVIAAPDYDPAALEILQRKKNLRILKLSGDYKLPSQEIRQISGGLLVQQPDDFSKLDLTSWQLVSGEAADSQTMQDLQFAWRAVRSVKSNAILLAHNRAAVGIGMGQVNRLDSCRLAVTRAGERVSGSVAASDAFFPFADGLEVLLEAGVKAIVQPGGSVRDEEVIASAKAAGVTMYFTGERHFFH